MHTKAVIRRKARLISLNIIYQVDTAGIPFDEALDTALEFSDLIDFDAYEAKDIRDYVRTLAVGVREKRRDIDIIISDLAKDWPLDRQPSVDRNILRIALYEIIFVDEVPDIVAVDEAIDIAKQYSTAESGKFVNGILAEYIREHKDELEKKERECENS